MQAIVRTRLSMAKRGGDIAAPSASKAPVRKYFEYMKDLTTGRAVVGEKKLRASCVYWRLLTQEEQPISKNTYVPTIAPNKEICMAMI